MKKKQGKQENQNRRLISLIEKEQLFYLMHDCITCKEESDFDLIIEQLKELIPFDYINCGLLRFAKKEIVAIEAYALAIGLPAWRETYFKEDLYLDDPVLGEYKSQFYKKELAVQYWSDTYKNTPDSKDFVEKAKDHGVRQGYTYGMILSPLTGALFSFFGDKIKRNQKTVEILDKFIPHLSIAMDKFPKGEIPFLTKAEFEICQLLQKGHTVKSIAEGLGKAQDTIKHHTKNVYEKLGIHSKEELLHYWAKKIKTLD